MTIRIVNVFAKSGLSAEGQHVLIGLSLSNGRTVWGHFIHLSNAAAAIQVVEKQIKPILQDESIDSFQTLISQLDALKETVTTTRVIKPEPKSSASGVPMSRRRVISGLLLEDEPERETISEERPIEPALRFAISQALYKAFALSENKTLQAVFSEELALPLLENKTVPLLVETTEANMAIVQPVLATAVNAIGYSSGGANQKQILGSNAELLQAHVRQVKDWLTAVTPETRPTIHLNIQGAFSELYDNNEGKILGALYGLEQAALPYHLVVENMVKGEITAVIQSLQTLRSYLKTRQMKTKLAAGYSLFAAGALRRIVAETAVDQIHLDPSQFGSISQSLSFILECKMMGIEVIVHGHEAVVDTAVAIALAAQSHSLSGLPHKLYNEMIKFSS